MSQSKRNNIIFYSVLIIIVILSISGTAFAIINHNKKVDNDEVMNNPKEEIKPYLEFKNVEKSNTIDIFKKYPINPIKINFNGEVSISGLKNKEIENKVNDKLKSLKVKENKYGNNCSINTNISNVLSISCGIQTINVNLKTGEEIVLEEIFDKDSDVYSFLVKSNYTSSCMWGNCYPEDTDYEYDNNIENTIAENLQKLKNNNYILSIKPYNAIITYKENDDEYNETYIEYYNFFNDVTIYDRFIDDSIYEEEITDYCEPSNCADKLYELSQEEQSEYACDSYFINDKTYLSFRINNNNNIDPDYNYYSKEITKLNLKDYIKLLETEILDKENLNIEGNNYTYIYINAYIYYHTANDYQVYYQIIKREYKKEDYIKYHLGFYEANNISEKSIDRVNMLIDKNKKITYLSDNPLKDIPNFEVKLYEYIMNELKNDDNDFSSYNTCDFSDDKDCETKKDYHNLIKEASYAIDKVNNKLHIYEEKLGKYAADSYVNTRVSLDIFSNTPLNIIKKINEGEALELFDKKGLSIIYLDSINCNDCKNLEIELNSIGKALNIKINNMSLNSSDTYDKLYSKLNIETTYENEKITYGEFLKRFKITPTVIIIKDGIMVDGFIGYKSANDIVAIFQKYI